MDLSAFSYPSWSNIFEKHLLYSIFLEIPENVLEYILCDSGRIILPKECFTQNQDDSDDDEDMDEQPTFLEFSKRVQEIIDDDFARKGVFLKTNFHCPKDAFWITAGRTLKIRDLSDFYQLVKASGVVREDVEKVLALKTIRPTFIFKEWMDIHPGIEFRCFVKNHNLIGISPRDWPQYHKHICQQAKDIRNDITTVFKENIKGRFPHPDYVFDVLRHSKETIRLIDFSPFDEKESDDLAFEWDDLKTMDASDDIAEFRYITSDVGIQPSKRNNYGVPQDVIDMFNNSSSSAGTENFTDFMIQQARNSQT